MKKAMYYLNNQLSLNSCQAYCIPVRYISSADQYESVCYYAQGYTEMPFQQAGSTSSTSSLSASSSSAISYPPALILILSALVHDMEQSYISYLVRKPSFLLN